MEDWIKKIAITLLPGVGAKTAKNLISYCGGIDAVFQARFKDLLKIPGVGRQTAQNIVHHSIWDLAERECRFIESNGVTPLFYLDSNYPARLKHIPDSPIVLYFKGNADLNASRIIGIVGTRKPSLHGVTWCEEFIAEISPFEPVIVSGLAYGIDVCAHRKSLESQISTIGVLGHGLSTMYPASHQSVANAMVVKGGLLSEYPSFTGPEKEHFPMRNRIIAGLCDALVVVETAAQGGSMITAQLANGYHKDVFALPGRSKDTQSKGCNLLIKTHQAELIESACDLALFMQWNLEKQAPVQMRLFDDFSEAETRIIKLFTPDEPLSIDQLTYQANMGISEMASLLLEMEFKGILKTLPGKRFILV